MAGDYSRRLFRRTKHYSGVLMQQGRVQLDADFNEQLDIQLYRTETETIDVIGRTGAPRHNSGFLIGAGPNNQDLSISAGRIYVDGLLCELESASTYVTQPHLPNPDNTSPVTSPPASPPNRRLSLQDGRYLVYLDTWQQERSALDDPLNSRSCSGWSGHDGEITKRLAGETVATWARCASEQSAGWRVYLPHAVSRISRL